MRKLKFYLVGFVPGLLIVFLFLNKKGASCSYFPNDRVIAETLTKTFRYDEGFQQEMGNLHITEGFLRDSILSKGVIDFERSHAQSEPCPDYLLHYPTGKPRYEIRFDKCKDNANFYSIILLRQLKK